MSRRRTKVAVPATSPTKVPAGLFDEDEDLAAQVGERLRRLSLGMTAALITARAFFPGEDADTGSGLVWVLAILLAGALAVIGLWASGTTRLRFSWVDAGVLSLVVLVGLSTTFAADRRPAITLGWEWAGFGMAYLLLRNLPRTRAEVTTLTGALLATAVALSVYGLYQVFVEFPVLKARYLASPDVFLAQLGIDPSSPSRKALEDRLLGSQEPIATFALANSLAGVLVGPAVIAIGMALTNLLRSEKKSDRILPVVIAGPPILILLMCLLLTKSRSAHIGFLVGLIVLAWQERHRVARRTLVILGGGLSGLFLLLVVAGAMAGQLDWEMLTQSTKSLRYRREYWMATWRLITSSAQVFGAGLGPGNFAGPYLRFKLPESSEEILDPHNMVLEAWTTGGIAAMLALVTTLGLALREALGPPRSDSSAREDSVASQPEEPPPPKRTTWLWLSAGSSMLVVIALGKLNPFEGEGLWRWTVLAFGWGWGAIMFWPLLRRQSLTAAALGAGVLALMVNLLAAGGIGMPPVALALWSMIALGQNLREDRPAGRLRPIGHRWCAFGLAIALAAIIGSFFGANMPHWRSEAAIAEAEDALKPPKPDPRQAMDAYLRAASTDRFSVRPWLGLANLRYMRWQADGSPPAQRVWPEIAEALDLAASKPRNENSLSVQRQRIAYLHELLRLQAQGNKDHPRMRNDLANAAAKAVSLYPGNASLHAELAGASAGIGRFDVAAREAREALRLDSLTPHYDKKLPEPLRKELREKEPLWQSEATKRK